MSKNQKKKVDVSLIVMILVVVAVLVLGGLAIAPKVKTAIETRKQEEMYARIEQGKGTVEDYAVMNGMKADEFISTYGLKGQVKADSLMSEAEEKMTLKNFWSYIAQTIGATDYGYSEENLEAFKTFYDGMMAEAEATEAPEAEATEAPKKVEITADTTDQTAKTYLYMYISQMQSEAMNGAVEVDPETDEVTTNPDATAAPEATDATPAPEAEVTPAPTDAAE